MRKYWRRIPKRRTKLLLRCAESNTTKVEYMKIDTVLIPTDKNEDWTENLEGYVFMENGQRVHRGTAVYVVEDTTLHIDTGKFVVFLGKNGDSV